VPTIFINNLDIFSGTASTRIPTREGYSLPFRVLFGFVESALLFLALTCGNSWHAFCFDITCRMYASAEIGAKCSISGTGARPDLIPRYLPAVWGFEGRNSEPGGQAVPYDRRHNLIW
jgi:hypothetical protein